MKIIAKDNFDRDDVNDRLICENVNKYYGKYLIDFLNEKFSANDTPDYFVLKEDNYKLYKFEP